MYTIIHETPHQIENSRVLMPRQFFCLQDGAPKLGENIVRLCPHLTSGQTKREAYPEPKVIWTIPSGRRHADDPWPCSCRSCVVGPGRPRYERSDDHNPEYSPSGTSSPYPVLPPPTFSDINSTLSVAGGSVRWCPQAPPSPPPLRSSCQVTVRPFSPGPRWSLPQKSSLPPLATPPLPPPHTESLCCRTVPGNIQQCTIAYPPSSDGTQWRLHWTGIFPQMKRRGSPGIHRPCSYLLRSFLPLLDGHHRRFGRRHCRIVHQRRCGCRLGSGEASS